MDSDICDQMDQEFFKNQNPHKFAVLWAAVFYRHINYIMRHIETGDIIKKFPCTTYYIIKYLRYFYRYGINKEHLSDISYLYRGLSENFDIKPHFTEHGFMSTSYDKKTARSFADNKGNMIIFPTKFLPDNVPLIVIDHNIADYLLESEILFPPGEIWTKQINNNIVGKYRMNEANINQYLSTKIPQSIWAKIQKGGHYHGKTIDDLLLMAGKWLVFHRTIGGREPEILGKIKVPTNKKKLVTFFMYELKSILDKYEHIMDLMTEVQDIQKLISDKGSKLTEKQKSELWSQMFSYNTYIAVYDPKNNNIETLYYDIMPSLSKELSINTSKNQQISHMILDNCSFLDETKVNTEWDNI